MKIGVGFNNDEDSYTAVKNAVEEAVKYSGKPIFSMVFTAGDYDAEMIRDTAIDLLGPSKILGACVPGIITRDGISTKGVGVFTISGPQVEIATFLHEDIDDSPDVVGRELGKLIKEQGPDSGTVFCLFDGRISNASEVLRTLHDTIGPGFNYLGGGNGDNLGVFSTYQFTENKTSIKSIAVAVVKGIRFNFGVDHGWEPLGEPLIVTKAEQKRVLEIDGIPAFTRYSMSTGLFDRKLFPEYSIRYPLGIPCYGGKFLIRDPLLVSEDDSIEFLTEVPQNTAATIMTSDIKALVNTAGNVTAEVRKVSGHPAILFVFDCVSRYLLMKEDFQQEIQSVLSSVDDKLPVLGILSFGEICSVSGVPLFYNKSIVVAMGEE